MNKKYTFTQILIGVLLITYSLHFSSCANTQGAPTGGPKDSIPPVVISVVPDSNSVKVPAVKTEIVLTFDEYVQLKDITKNILLSPPQKKRPEAKIKGKSIVVKFEDNLDSAKTYNLSFGEGIADNNEGNILLNYNYPFSTGDFIDSMFISGKVMDYSDLYPQKGITVAIYENAKDSSVINTLPDAVAVTDEWGYFVVRNIKAIPYTIFAFQDDNSNNLYDPGTEMIGFMDTLITPMNVMKKGLPQLANYEEDDTLGFESRPSELSLYIFKERNSVQYIRDYKRVSERGAYVTFNAPDVIIDSFSVRGIRQDRLIKLFNQTKDSLSFWINDQRDLVDTLELGIKYHKTDSLGVLVPTVENLKLVFKPEPKEEKKESESSNRRNRDKMDDELPDRDDLLKMIVSADPKMVEQDGYILEFPDPILQAKIDTIEFKTITARRDTIKGEFSVIQDSLNIKRYILKPNKEFEVGNDYILYIPKATFTDINGFTNDSTVKTLALPIDDKLSSLTLDITNVDTRYVVELINSKRDKTFRTYTIMEDTKLYFPYLTAGEYSVRIFEDLNSNTLIDPGDLLKRKQPELVKIYEIQKGETIFYIKEKLDIEQSIDMKSVFGSAPIDDVALIDNDTIIANVPLINNQKQKLIQ